ncbi:ANTAR domain-containing protein [uncultured Jatrophihabitans sp.]|uniref:ANTAR domain-containing protein n=1 Tax=uncultured Jatrophihabitans sp. TaxID=1610747 RepID=UPI0035CB8FD3
MTAAGDDDVCSSAVGLSSAAAAGTDLREVEWPAQVIVSSDPTEVFTSLAAYCASVLCDQCSIDLVGRSVARPPSYHRVSYPARSGAIGGNRGQLDRLAADGALHVVRVQFDSAPSETDGPGPDEFGGVAAFGWHRRAATRAEHDMAGVLVDHAVRTVLWQRSVAVADAAASKAANLTIALETSRHIGAAIGILMYQRKIPQDAAFELLRLASQRTNRKLRDLACDVIDTGWLDPGPRGADPDDHELGRV